MAKASKRVKPNIHAVYAVVIIILIVLGVIIAGSYASHVKADAARDATIKAQNEYQAEQGKTIQDLEKQIEIEKQAASAQIAQLQQQKATVVAQPAQVPDAFFQLLKQLVPNAQPIRQDRPLTKDMAPDAPSATLTKQNQIDLFTAAASCKECFIENQQLQGEVEKQKQITADKDNQLASVKQQRDAAIKDAHGGSVFQRTWRVVKWGAIFGATGYIIGRSRK